MKKLAFLTILSLIVMFTNAQNIDQSILTKTWKAYWISHPKDSQDEFTVYHFRKEISLAENPQSFVVNISADNHYKLYVNGQLASVGPASSDLNHWKYETVDIAAFLHVGKNMVGATVWNEGKYKAITQFSNSTAFILQGNTAREYELNTNRDWVCVKILHINLLFKIRLATMQLIRAKWLT